MAEFQSTCWTLVLTAAEGDPEARQTALERLCSGYWPPVYAYIRRRGQGEEEARDLTQEFFARLLEKGWLQAADPTRGKFRAFLLTTLKRFLADVHDWAVRQKRGGGAVHIPLDWEEAEAIREPAESPEAAFDRRWALTVLWKAGERLREEAEAAGRQEIFSLLGPFIASEPEAGDYDAVGARTGLSRAAVSMAVHRLRVRLRELMRAEVAETLADRAAVDAEMAELMAALRR